MLQPDPDTLQRTYVRSWRLYSASKLVRQGPDRTLLDVAAVAALRATGNPGPGPSPSGSVAAAEGTGGLTRLRRILGAPREVKVLLNGATNAVDRRAIASCAGCISVVPR